MQEFRNFPFNDGHIESILIGVDTVKLAFHTWDDKQCNFVFRESFYLKNNSGISGDIGEVKIETLKKDTSQEYDKILGNYSEAATPYLIRFFDSWDEEFAVLTVVALSVDIIDCGEAAGINNALYDVAENQFIGGQQRIEYGA